MSGALTRIEAAAGEVCDIYRRLFPDHEVRIYLNEGEDPAFGHPEIIHGPIEPDSDLLRPGPGKQITLPGPDDHSRIVSVIVSIPRPPTRDELENKQEKWVPRQPFKTLFSVSPLAYEQLRFGFEAWRKHKAKVANGFAPIPLGRGLPGDEPKDVLAQHGHDRPAVLIGFHWLEVGGAEKLGFDSVKWALDAGLRVFVVADVPALQRLADTLPDHPDLTYIRLDRYLNHQYWPEFIEKFVRGEGIRLIHIHHCRQLYASLEHLRHRAPWVEVIDSTHIVERADGGFPRVSGLHTNLVDMHHVISDSLRDFYRDKFDAQDIVKLGRLLDDRDSDAVLPAINMKAGQDKLSVAFVGRMVYQKRPIVVVKILQQLAKWCDRNGVAFQATVVGDGPMKPAVDALVRRYGLADKVRLEPGNVDVLELFRNSDILLLPSNNEGLALVCYEAIEQGCIPISTDVGAQGELVPADLLVPVSPIDSVKETVKIVDRLWRDPDFLARNGKDLHARFHKIASERTAKDLLSETYRTVAKGENLRPEKKKLEEISAVVVTYNRSDKLMNVLDALRDQSVRLKRIFVIDNASTDNTAQLVQSRSSAMPNLRYIRLEQNIGGAGGFHAGIEAAYLDGADAIWISDDDAYPEPDAIEKLRDALTTFETKTHYTPSFACSRVEWTNGDICEMNIPTAMWDWARFVGDRNTRPLVGSCSFVSVLVPRWAITTHGLPIPDYFIWFDDAEYTRRLTRSYPGIFVPESRVIHDMPQNQGVNYGLVTKENVWKFRYGARNETSFRLRETGLPGALAFAYKVRREMLAGNVPFSLRRKIYTSLLRGWTFRPAIPPAPEMTGETAAHTASNPAAKRASPSAAQTSGDAKSTSTPAPKSAPKSTAKSTAKAATGAGADTAADSGAKKTLYLHIGHYKTGTSALQDYLSNNADALRDHGYYYPASARPERNNTNHGHLSLSVARDHGFRPPGWYGENIPTDDAFESFFADVNQAPEDKIIVSSEEFVQLAMCKDPEAALRDLKARLAGFDVKVVFYIREPFSLLKSWYNQVNKGKMGTRNFTTFFMSLKTPFLAQAPIWKHFSQAFGVQNTMVLTYKKIGAEHIEEFLGAIGCDHTPTGDFELVNPAQPLSTLELRRLAKERNHTHDEAMLTSFESVEKFVKKANRITTLYDEMAARSDEPRMSRLTPVSIIQHYGALMESLDGQVQLNQQEAGRMQSLALQAEATDLRLAEALMSVAHTIRPEGKTIREKLEAYRAALDAADQEPGARGQ